MISIKVNINSLTSSSVISFINSKIYVVFTEPQKEKHINAKVF